MTLNEGINQIKRIAAQEPIFIRALYHEKTAYETALQAMSVIKKQQEIIEILTKALEAIIEDNKGDFSNYAGGEFLQHIENEKYFCESTLDKAKQLTGE
jgi:hypothetical protein